MYIAVCLPFVSRYTFHLCHNTFGRALVVGVTGMLPIVDASNDKSSRFVLFVPVLRLNLAHSPLLKDVDQRPFWNLS